MGIRGKAPRKGGDGGGYWKWLKVRPGSHGAGWIAGDIHPYPAHVGRPSVVCEKTLTGGRAKCLLCETGTPVRDMGYLPIFRDDNFPCVLFIHEYSFDHVAALPHLSPILFGKHDADDCEATYVRQHLAGKRYETTLLSRLKKQDLTIATVRYWKRPDLLAPLVAWWAGAVTVVETGPPAELVNRVEEHEREKAQRSPPRKREPLVGVDGKPLPPLLSDATSEVLRRNRAAAKNPPPNGVHG